MRKMFIVHILIFLFPIIIACTSEENVSAPPNPGKYIGTVKFTEIISRPNGLYTYVVTDSAFFILYRNPLIYRNDSVFYKNDNVKFSKDIKWYALQLN